MTQGPIGIFDSGYGGLTVMREITRQLPPYDYLYLGDNARAPYGPRSFETVYAYTLEAVEWFFGQGCPLVILACNTASAKALRSIQQHNLDPYPGRRVLGVIRPTSEIIGQFTRTGHVGVLGTTGTVQSNSYPIEISHFFPDVQVHQQACPMWVPLIENNEHLSAGADYFVADSLQKLRQQHASIDTILLGCTHYPLLVDKIRQFLPANVQLISQGGIVAQSLADYLQRHPEIEQYCTKGGRRAFVTTDDPVSFSEKASVFYGERVEAQYHSWPHG
jgi:glutamate racemase